MKKPAGAPPSQILHERRVNFRRDVEQAVVLGGNEQQALLPFSEKLAFGAEDLVLKSAEFPIRLGDLDLHRDRIELAGFTDELVLEGAREDVELCRLEIEVRHRRVEEQLAGFSTYIGYIPKYTLPTEFVSW